MRGTIIGIRSCVVLGLMSLMLHLPVPGQTTSNGKAAKMKAEVQKLGVGPNAKLEVQLSDRRRVRGYISEIKDESFVLITEQSGTATEIRYSDAEKAKKPLSKGVKIAIGVGVAFAAFVGLAVLLCRSNGCD